jgi:hypothetical protein
MVSIRSVLVVIVATSIGVAGAQAAEHTSFVGNREEIAAIRRSLPAEICAKAIPSYIFQSGKYAITEGSCGDPEMHGALVKAASGWRLNRRCRFGGGVIPNDVLQRNLIACGFPADVATKLVKLRRM